MAQFQCRGFRANDMSDQPQQIGRDIVATSSVPLTPFSQPIYLPAPSPTYLPFKQTSQDILRLDTICDVVLCQHDGIPACIMRGKSSGKRHSMPASINMYRRRKTGRERHDSPNKTASKV